MGDAVATAVVAAARTPASRSTRILEVVPGVVTWTVILAPLAISLRWPELVAWFVLTFDVYWLYRAVMLTASVVVASRRIRSTSDVDWRTRVFALRDIDLTKLESRPARGKPWEYLFYVDIGVGRDDVRCMRAIGHLTESAQWVRTLGSYQRWTGEPGLVEPLPRAQ